MANIMKDLKKLKEKGTQQHYAIRRDEHVKLLEGQVKWFREEALRLDTKLREQIKVN